jgi:hypothetical protein
VNRVPLGPLEWAIAAPRSVVFDIVAAPYLGRTPRALASKLEVRSRTANAVVAAHFTRVLGGIRVTTIEEVTFRRPELVAFRLLSGPVADVAETFELSERAGETRFVWRGELSSRSRLWARIVARRWRIAVEESLRAITAEAERRARR